jgi:hypothetical protein
VALVRRLALALLIASCGDDGEPEPPPEPPPIVPAPRVDLATTQPPGWDIEIRVPKDWTGSYRMRTEHEVQFAGPGAPGEKPEMDFGWKASDRDLETFARETFRRYENPAYKVLRTGSETIAGMPARFCVYETAKQRGIEYCFAGHGYIGFIRGYSKIDEFPKWGAAFEEAARRAQYKPR